MEFQNAICLVVDRFHAGMLGPYGNTWIRTPELDRLASEGFVFDQAFADSTRLESLYRAYWHGLPALSRARHPGPSLARLLADAGVSTALLTDDAEIGALPGAGDFEEKVDVESSDASMPADDESQTQLGRFFAAAADWLTGARRPFFLWLHSRGMAGAWDAPLELRIQYVEEEDPRPPASTVVPCYRLGDDADPDEILGLSYAYAGQVSLLDICLGVLVDQLRESQLAESTLVVLIGARGFPLGEHGHVGPWDEALYNETVQIPWMVRFPDGLGQLGRSQALTAPADLPATLLDWWGIGGDKWPGRAGGHSRGHTLLPIVRGDTLCVRDHLYMTSGLLPRVEENRDLSRWSGERALRTPAWHLKLSATDAHRPEAHPGVELYAKPSDRWEVNEVADRCPEIATALKDSLLQIEEHGNSSGMPPLAEPLVTEFD